MVVILRPVLADEMVLSMMKSARVLKKFMGLTSTGKSENSWRGSSREEG